MVDFNLEGRWINYAEKKTTMGNFHQSWQGDLRVWVQFKLELSGWVETSLLKWLSQYISCQLCQAWNATIHWKFPPHGIRKITY